MTENSDKVPIALVGPDDVEFCSPPVSTARGPPGLRGPGLRRPGSTICTELGRWEPIRAPRCGLGVAPHAGAGAEAGASPDAREEDGGQGARRGRRGGKTWQTRGAATLNREESAQRPSRPEDQGPAARGARRNGAPGGARGAVPHSHPRPDAAVAARSLDASSPGRPQAYAAVTVKPSSPARLLKVGAVVLISGAVLLLLGAIGAFYFWKGSDNHIYNVHYTMSINGKLQDGSMEIDAGNNLETFKMGSGAEEAVEVNDFQNGITGIRFAGGEKCYIKAQVKARIPEVDTMTKQSISSELEGKIMPVKYEENSLIWVAGDQPVKDNSFLSSKVLELCDDLPIFWLKPTYPKEIQRERRELVRKIVTTTTTRRLRSGPRGTPGPERPNNGTRPSIQEDAEPFNPDNPYHQQEGESMTFDPRLDHEGICCIECRRSYTHCQKICEPLGGYHPWPYNYQGCRSACRVIMPCSWWVARILGMV
ncbi:hypothetical protein MJT46_019737 [Ovis ammon polii x Ovis aries]|nr:hypothetical protein MJT46_019737 [Ovis ammon polii x Ovis aries]